MGERGGAREVRGVQPKGVDIQPRIRRHAALLHLVQQIAHRRRGAGAASGGHGHAELRRRLQRAQCGARSGVRSGVIAGLEAVQQRAARRRHGRPSLVAASALRARRSLWRRALLPHRLDPDRPPLRGPRVTRRARQPYLARRHGCGCGGGVCKLRVPEAAVDRWPRCPVWRQLQVADWAELLLQRDAQVGLAAPKGHIRDKDAAPRWRGARRRQQHAQSSGAGRSGARQLRYRAPEREHSSCPLEQNVESTAANTALKG